MKLEDLKNAENIIVGTKQTTKAITQGKVKHIFLAGDAEERITRPVLEACNRQNIPVTWVDSMAELGKACKIKVKAAMAAVLASDD